MFLWERLLLCNVPKGATAVLGAAAVGAASKIFSANKAAKAQTEAVDKSNALIKNMYDTTRGDLSAYRDIGGQAASDLSERLPFLTSPIEMTQANLEKTPGYQFTKQQGLKATQNAAAARGLGVSGAALKGASAFATNLANTTYKDQFELENINRTNAFNRLKGVVDTGQQAAAATGGFGATAATQMGANTIGAGNAQAAAANASGAAISKAADTAGGYYYNK